MKEVIPLQRGECQQELLGDAARLAGDVDDASPLIGYVVLAFYGDGENCTAAWRPQEGNHRMGAALFEAWAVNTLKHHFVFGQGIRAAEAVLNDD